MIKAVPMKAGPLCPLVLISMLCASPANAQNPFPGGPRSNATRANGNGAMPNEGFSTPFWIWGEREVVHEVVHEVIREVPAAPAPPPEPPPPPRKPYKIGASYASLPGQCMKMIEKGASYFLCSGEWYRQVGAGYLAVREP